MDQFIAQAAEWIQLLISLEFWQQQLDHFQLLGPLVPILLACLESFIPALPLVAIVTLNVLAHGPVLGFLYSWSGSMLGCFLVFTFYRKLIRPLLGKLLDKYEKLRRAQAWVTNFDHKALFLLATMPATPSSFLNLAFGISEYPYRQYLVSMAVAKLVMVLLLAVFGQSISAAFENPVFLVLSLVLFFLLFGAAKKLTKKHDL